jgi:hypothetical protein
MAFIGKPVFAGTEYRSRATGLRYIVEEPDDEYGYTIARSEDFTQYFYGNNRAEVCNLIEAADNHRLTG